MSSKYSNVKNLAGKLSLNEELDVISNLDVMLAMDSGNAHISAMLGVPVVTVWGVTHPFSGFIPFNQPQENCLLSDRLKYPLIPTSVYGNKYPDSYINASESIAVKNVINKIESLL
jgi:ADP-heptose:LPS heptosyltransferase